MNIHELDSYNLADAVKFNDELNTRIWQGSRMRPEVRKKLLAIAQDFKQSLGLSDLEVKDITLSGSNAGYTYTPHSDIDLHLVVDVPQNETDEVYRELFNAKKYQYNDEHNLSIGGYPVELYVQDANQIHHSQGIYSVANNDWTSIPRKRESTVNDGAVKSKYELMKHRIDSAIDSGDIKRLTRTAARIKQMRQAGLDKNGELGPENLAYKMLRTQGLIEKLYTARTAAKDQQLSLQERKKKKKSRVRYGFGGYYTPGFSFGNDAGGDAGDGGGGESVREDATISPYGVSPTTQMFLNETGDSEQTVHDFISHAAETLGIENMPTIELHTDPAWSEREHSFGRYTPNTHTLEVNLANRHIMDILRTVAHELVHCRQHELSPLPDEAGETGSRWENEAHAKAGELMRDYADANPTRFGEHALAEASGYIPTKAQAKDKRFSTALTVDVHPGQTGKEANKMGLQTDAQGRPALLMKGLANQLHEEFEQFDEGVALFEINMTGKTVWQHDPGEAIDAMRRRSKIQFLKPDDQGMTEVFEPGKQNWKWRRQSSDEAFASFVVGDREYQWHAFSSEANPARWEIQFRLMRAATDPDGLDLFGQTGTGNSAQVLSTAVDITRAFLEVYGLDKVEEITFNAKEDSRIDLYVRMIKRLLPNWDLSSRKSISYGMQFTLTDPRAYDKPENKIAQGVAEGLEFFSMPLRMSEYRGKHHPATNQPYDARFKFSGDLKDRVHSLLDAGTKPTLLQVNPRHLLATQDWLSTQGGGKAPFATMKQHPVVLQKNNKLYILDGHHRSADAHKSGAPIEVYLFRDEL